MGMTKSALQKGNPLRSDMSWELAAVQGVFAIGVGIYALTSEASAQRNITFLIGVFLLLNGLSYGLNGVRSQGDVNPLIRFGLIRSGIGIATGLIVVINRFADFMNINAARTIAGIGLIGIGAITIWGIVVTSKQSGVPPIGFVISSFLLAAWGILMLVQAARDNSMTRWFGWAAIVVGLGLIGIALLRRQSASQPVAV